MPVDEESIRGYIVRTFEGVEVVGAPDTRFFFYDPDRSVPHDRRQPFATLVTSDAHDTASDLGRPGVFRLNVGVGRGTYRAMFGPEPAWNREGGPVATGHDFTVLDAILPHPIYAPLSWICVLNPSDATWERVRPMLSEAYALAVKRHPGSRGGHGERA